MRLHRNGRRFVAISKVFAEIGWRHGLVVSLLDLLKIGSLEKLAFESGKCHVVSRSRAGLLNPKLRVTDRVADPAADVSSKELMIDYDFENYLSGEVGGDSLFLPILFSPNFISEYWYRYAKRCSLRRKRSVRVLFAGSSETHKYDKSELSERYRVLNRCELLGAVKDISEEVCFFPSSFDEFNQARLAGRLKNRIVWVDTAKFKIPSSEWMNVLSDSEFFLCPPGVAYPYSHNMNESSACGCVPVIEFGGLYSPSLQDGVNCVAFSGRENFFQQIRRILSGEYDEQWCAMSQAAVEYHEQYLSLSFAKHKLTQFMEDPFSRRLRWVMAGKKSRTSKRL